jgi:hypothetical protein
VLRRIAVLLSISVLLGAAAGCSGGTEHRPNRATPAPAPAPATATPEVLPSPFGVNLSYDTSSRPADIHRLIDRMADLHVQWARVGLDALDAKSTDGRLDVGFADDVVDRLRQRGMGVLLLLGGSRRACTVSVAEDGYVNCPPDRSREQQYGRYVEQFVDHFKGRVIYFESWNEPNDKAYWVTGPDPADYARVLSVQYPAVKRANPEARVLFASTGATDLPWTAQALAALGGERPYDEVALHPYRTAGGPHDATPFTLADGSTAMLDLKGELLASVGAFRDYDARHGRAVEPPPVWLTEMGWGAKSAQGGEEVGGVTLASYADQARYLHETVGLMRDDPDLAFVQVMLWWNAVDLEETDPEAPYFDFYGLLRVDLSSKPVADAFAELSTGGRRDPRDRVML